MVIASEGRIEEEIYLTTFLWEEAKHTEFFRRFLDEVAQEHSDLHHFHPPSYRKIFYEELPQAMHALLTDQSLQAQADSSRAGDAHRAFGRRHACLLAGDVEHPGFRSAARLVAFIWAR